MIAADRHCTSGRREHYQDRLSAAGSDCLQQMKFKAKQVPWGDGGPHDGLEGMHERIVEGAGQRGKSRWTTVLRRTERWTVQSARIRCWAATRPTTPT